MQRRPEGSHTVQLVPAAPAPGDDSGTPRGVVRHLLGVHRTIDTRLGILLKPDTALSAATCATVIRSCLDDFQAIHREEARKVFPALQAQAVQAVGSSQRVSGRMQMAALSRRLVALFQDMLEGGQVPPRANLLLARSVLKKALLIRHRHFYQPMLTVKAETTVRNVDVG
ncbi:MAG: hypothetical protein R3F22_01730 [Lysobacteraceae bacterium]